MEKAVRIKSDVEEEYFSDCIFEDEMKSEVDVTHTSDYVKSEDAAIKYQPIETVSRTVVKEDGLQHTQIKKEIKDEHPYDFENGNFQVATEGIEVSSINTLAGVKYEEVDLKYESLDDISLSTTENGETFVTRNQICDKVTNFSDDKLKHNHLNLIEMKCKGDVEEDTTANLHYLKKPEYQCNSCSYKTQCKSNLRYHVSVHMAPKYEYECNVCSYKTQHKSNLRTHTLIHTDRSKTLKYKCSSCPYKAYRSSSLHSHMLLHADPSKTPKFECYVCGYTTRRKSNLRGHVSIHMDSKYEYECNVCSYKARRRYHLQRHMLGHTKTSETEKKFECTICPYKTRWKLCLQRHMVVHTNPKKAKYECNNCEYKTWRKADLRKHVLVHTYASKSVKCK